MLFKKKKIFKAGNKLNCKANHKLTDARTQLFIIVVLIPYYVREGFN